MKMLLWPVVFAGLSTMVACGANESNKHRAKATGHIESSENEDSAVHKCVAKAIIGSASGSKISGEATFTALDNGDVAFVMSLAHAAPGDHAINIHQYGDCSAPDAKTAGSHWNPTNVDHGKRGSGAGVFHAGDIDNISVAEDSTGSLVMNVKGWSIGGNDSTNILNKAIIIHAMADDFESQPFGAAGKRIGCGVINLE